MRKQRTKAVPQPKEGGGRWVTKDQVRHWRSGKLMKRKNGEPFKFFIRPKRRVA